MNLAEFEVPSGRKEERRCVDRGRGMDLFPC